MNSKESIAFALAKLTREKICLENIAKEYEKDAQRIEKKIEEMRATLAKLDVSDKAPRKKEEHVNRAHKFIEDCCNLQGAIEKFKASHQERVEVSYRERVPLSLLDDLVNYLHETQVSRQVVIRLKEVDNFLQCILIHREEINND